MLFSFIFTYNDQEGIHSEEIQHEDQEKAMIQFRSEHAGQKYHYEKCESMGPVEKSQDA